MDLLIEKLDGSRYYLSQYKVLITDFEESAPTVTRNSKQIDQRNGSIDFGGWHTDKTINVTGYYRAYDIDEEEMLREKLYALLSDPDGYYITQLKTTPSVAMERPGETSGGYYDKLSNYPSHKRFLVYTEAPEMELVGNVNGTLLYKLTAEFKTMKLPYGETPAIDIGIDSPYKDVPVNLLSFDSGVIFGKFYGWPADTISPLGYRAIFNKVKVTPNNKYTISADWSIAEWLNIYAFTNESDTTAVARYGSYGGLGVGSWNSSFVGGYTAANNMTFTVPANVNYIGISYSSLSTDTLTLQTLLNGKPKLELGTTASPWSPNPADPEYNSWRYGLTGNVSIPYSGTVPCNQLEQQFAIELTAMGSASSLSFKIDDTELTYSDSVVSGDVFMFTGFSYTKNGLSIVSNTNKAYFVLQPGKPNRITCNVPGTVQILGFQNLYA